MICLDASVQYSPNNIAQTLNQINNRLEALSNRFDGISNRVNGMSDRVNGISDRVQDIDQRTEGMQNQMTAMNETLQIGHALTANLRIVNRNTRLQKPVEPLRKTVRRRVALCSINANIT